jgi:ABC-type Zn uptake system ZnuABC Zn-binding protein ZnuA
MTRRLLIALALLIALIPAGASTSAQSDKPVIVASFSILADVAAQVAGDSATVVSLMPLGANPHTYSPTAQDVVRLSDADRVLVVGANYEETLLPVVEEAAGERVIAVSQCVPIRPIPGSSETAPVEAADGNDELPPGEWSEICAAHEAEIEAAFEQPDAGGAVLGPLYALPCGDAHAETEPDEDHAHEPGACDPHVWTDPTNAARWALLIRDTLSELDPSGAETYAANAEAFLAELAALDAELRAQIDAIPSERRVIVTNHVALTYFAERYGLEQVGVIIPSGSTTSEPSVREVLELIDTVQTRGVPAIFTETTASDATAAQIAAESGVALVPLYTGSLSQPDGGAGTYLDYMRYNAAAIADALR